MNKERLNQIINDVISKTIVENQNHLNSDISKDILDAYNDNPNLSLSELIFTLSNSYMNSAVELSVRAVIDILDELNIININT